MKTYTDALSYVQQGIDRTMVMCDCKCFEILTDA